MSKTLEKILEMVTGLTWVSSTQSYRLNGPPGSYSSAEVRVARGRLCKLGDSKQVLEELHGIVLEDCKDRIGHTVVALEEMVEEHTPV